jgi:hypothetical protein
MSGKIGQVYDLGPLSVQFVPIHFWAANAPYSVEHKLDRTDVAWMVGSKSDACDIFEGRLPRARNSVSLMSDTAGIEAVIVLIGSNLGN